MVSYFKNANYSKIMLYIYFSISVFLYSPFLKAEAKCYLMIVENCNSTSGIGKDLARMGETYYMQFAFSNFGSARELKLIRIYSKGKLITELKII
jgi:hypothetical protein